MREKLHVHASESEYAGPGLIRQRIRLSRRGLLDESVWVDASLIQLGDPADEGRVWVELSEDTARRIPGGD